MNLPHIIRIRGPWQRSVLATAGDVASDSTKSVDSPLRQTVQMPGGWANDLGSDFRGRVRYERSFNKPSSIDDSTPLFIVFEKIVGNARISLNQSEVGLVEWPVDSARLDVAGKLLNRNDLVVEIRAIDDAGVSDGGLVGEVRLEIS